MRPSPLPSPTLAEPAATHPEEGGGPTTGQTPPRPLGVRALTAIFAAECLALSALQLPTSLNLHWFLGYDLGANLTAQALLDRGYVPNVDFGYLYGLAPLAVGRLWFGLFGLTPAAYAAAMTAIRLVVAWGMARCAANLRVGPAGVALMICGMPLAAQPTYIHLNHALEAALICHALADQAVGRRPRALALVTAALFMKPSMAYVYGLLLVILIVRSAWASGAGARPVLRALLPAAVTGLALAAALAVLFGPDALIRSLLPATGAEAYRLHNYGFFRGRGRAFWLPDNAGLRYYLLTPAGSYLAGLLLLVAATAEALRRLARLGPGRTDPVAEVVACGGLMQAVFVTMFYADQHSYQYYYNVLIVSLAAASALGHRWSLAVGALAVAVLLGYKWPINNDIRAWQTTSPSTEFAGLWCGEADRRELGRVRALIDGRPASFLTANGGCFEMVVPGFAPAENWILDPGTATPGELARKLAQIDGADAVVVIRSRPHPVLVEWPEIRSKLDAFDVADTTENYQVFTRRVPGLTGPEPSRPAPASAGRP